MLFLYSCVWIVSSCVSVLPRASTHCALLSLLFTCGSKVPILLGVVWQDSLISLLMILSGGC